MKIEIKCTAKQQVLMRLAMREAFNNMEDEIDWKIIEYGHITYSEIDAFGSFSDEQRDTIKKKYAENPKGTFPNPMCALY